MANEGVSLELTLSCSSSSTSGKSGECCSSEEQEVSKRRHQDRNQAFKIAGMKVYSPSEEEEEKKLSTRLNLYEDSWTIKKVLTNSDVNGSSRLLLSTHVIEEQIIKRMRMEQMSIIEKIYSNEGARIRVLDYDTNMSEYELTLKRWPSTGSFVFVNNWKRDFEKRRGLKCDDEIGMLWDPFHSLLWFRVLHRGSYMTTAVQY